MYNCIFAIAAMFLCVSSVAAQGNFDFTGGFWFRNWGGPLGSDRSIINEVGVFNADGSPLPNEARFKIEALVARPGGKLTRVATTDMSSFDVPGFFDGGVVAVPGFEQREEAVLNIRAWDSTVGGTFKEAKSAGVRFGSSGEFTVTLGGRYPEVPLPPGRLPDAPAHLVGFEGFSLVPEPSTIILAMLGMGAFVLRRCIR